MTRIVEMKVSTVKGQTHGMMECSLCGPLGMVAETEASEHVEQHLLDVHMTTAVTKLPDEEVD